MMRCHKCLTVMELEGEMLVCAKCGFRMDAVKGDSAEYRAAKAKMARRTFTIAGGVIGFSALVLALLIFATTGPRDASDLREAESGFDGTFLARTLPETDQPDGPAWGRAIGSHGADRLIDFAVRPDRSATALIGVASESSGGQGDVETAFLVRLSDAGESNLRVSALPFIRDGKAAGMTVLAGGETIVAGYDGDTLETRAFSPRGKSMWSRPFDAERNSSEYVLLDHAAAVIHVAGPGSAPGAVRVAALNARGDTLWNIEQGVGEQARLLGLASNPDGGATLAIVEAAPDGTLQVSLVRVDDTGAEQWRRSVGAPPETRFSNMVGAPDGGVFLVFEGANASVALMDRDGIMAWMKSLPPAALSSSLVSAPAPVGVVIGVAYDLPHRAREKWLGHYDMNGDLSGALHPRSQGFEIISHLQAAGDRRVIAGGAFRENEYVATDVFLSEFALRDTSPLTVSMALLASSAPEEPAHGQPAPSDRVDRAAAFQLSSADVSPDPVPAQQTADRPEEDQAQEGTANEAAIAPEPVVETPAGPPQAQEEQEDAEPEALRQADNYECKFECQSLDDPLLRFPIKMFFEGVGMKTADQVAAETKFDFQNRCSAIGESFNAGERAVCTALPSPE